MSKSDYLTKYTDEGTKSVAEKKKKKGHKVIRTKRLHVNDIDDSWKNAETVNNRLDRDDLLWNADDEDNPVVTETEETKHETKGVWIAVGEEEVCRSNRARHDSDDDASPPRKRVGSPGDSSPPRAVGEGAAVFVSKRRKTASGHEAGLQSSDVFGHRERELKALRDKELAGADASDMGVNAETVYRDRRGKKLDMLNEFMRQQAVREGKEVKIAKAQYAWGKGSVQKDEAEARRKELEEIANEPFARTAEDPRLEAMRKEVIRDGDPMAEFFRKKREESACSENSAVGRVKKRKPEYKGPAGPPNRFEIRPGYRWDGIDRGSAFEVKLLTRANDRAALKEDEYKWSVADM